MLTSRTMQELKDLVKYLEKVAAEHKARANFWSGMGNDLQKAQYHRGQFGQLSGYMTAVDLAIREAKARKEALNG